MHLFLNKFANGLCSYLDNLNPDSVIENSLVQELVQKTYEKIVNSKIKTYNFTEEFMKRHIIKVNFYSSSYFQTTA